MAKRTFGQPRNTMSESERSAELAMKHGATAITEEEDRPTKERPSKTFELSVAINEIRTLEDHLVSLASDLGISLDEFCEEECEIGECYDPGEEPLVVILKAGPSKIRNSVNRSHFLIDTICNALR